MASYERGDLSLSGSLSYKKKKKRLPDSKQTLGEPQDWCLRFQRKIRTWRENCELKSHLKTRFGSKVRETSLRWLTIRTDQISTKPNLPSWENGTNGQNALLVHQSPRCWAALKTWVNVSRRGPAHKWSGPEVSSRWFHIVVNWKMLGSFLWLSQKPFGH